MKLIFYTLYRWANKFNFWDTPQLSALYFLALFLTFNILSIYVYVKLMLGYSPRLLEFNKIVYVILFAFIAIIINLVFVRNKKYLAIASDYEGNANFRNSKASIITIIYIIVTILLFLSLGFYKI